MTTLDHLNALTRIPRTLEEIVARWPECSATQLLECAKLLPSIIDELPLPDVTTSRAVQLYIENLGDSGAVPPWVG